MLMPWIYGPWGVLCIFSCGEKCRSKHRRRKFMQKWFRGERKYFFGQTNRIEYPERTPPDLLELLKGMLDIEFKNRWKIKKIITHSWVTNNGELDL
jgi:hypothetical protein